MKHPAWLVELHRQWFAARGRKLGGRSRPFTRNWSDLLESAEIFSAEDIATAEREASKLHDEKRLDLIRNKYKIYLIERLRLPSGSEQWLRGIFATQDPETLRNQSMALVEAALAKNHPLHSALWRDWTRTIGDAFACGRNAGPLSWRHPEVVGKLLDLTYDLTSRAWPLETYVREASVDLGLQSKHLERSQRAIEACLGAMFGRVTPLEKLGIVGSQPRSEISGELLLHFPDGPSQPIDELKGIYYLTSDLNRATKVTTPAKRILTIENSKTTLRRLATLNADKNTLILACAYPSRGLVRLMDLLPAELPVFHFGDTDPAGFLILSKLRRAIGRPVIPFLMERRRREQPVPLTGYDRSILPGLLADPMLEDVRPHLGEIASSGDKGDFEQESLGRPDLPHWPFYHSVPGDPDCRSGSFLMG